MTEVAYPVRSVNKTELVEVMRSLSNDEMTTFKQTFNLFDQDGDGLIAPFELSNMMKSLNMNISESDARSLAAEVDVTKAGGISFEGFVYLMKTPVGPSKPSTPSKRRSSISKAAVTGVKTSSSILSSLGLGGISSPNSPTTNSPGRKNSGASKFGLINLFNKGSRRSESEKIRVSGSGESGAQTEELKEVFKVFDLNGDGFLSVSEMRNVMDKLGLGVVMKEEEVRQLFSLVDSNNDGLITESEFVTLFSMC